MLEQGLLHGGGIIRERPRERARVSDFDEAHLAREPRTQAADERPISVNARQVNQRGQRRIAVNAELEDFFGHFALLTAEAQRRGGLRPPPSTGLLPSSRAGNATGRGPAR